MQKHVEITQREKNDLIIQTLSCPFHASEPHNIV